MHGFNLQEVIYKVIKKRSHEAVFVVDSFTSHLTPNALPASTAILAAVPHGHLFAATKPGDLWGGSLDSLSSRCFPVVFHALRILG